MQSFYTLGVDPAKHKVTAALLSPLGEILLRPTDFNADRAGFDGLLTCLRERLSPGDQLRVGTEATASLDDNFLGWLSLLRERFVVLSYRLDPGQVARFSGARPIRGKTDSADALRIARFTATYAGELVRFESDPREEAMRRLVNERERLAHERTALCNRLHDRVTISFPEIYQVFANPCLQTPLCLLEQCPTARDVARKRAATVARLQPVARAGFIGEERAKKLIALARSSVASATQPSDGDTIRFIIRQLRALDGRIGAIDENLRGWAANSTDQQPAASSLPAQVQLLRSIPGIGFQGAATIVLRCGNLLRYASPRALAAQLGACPDRHQTGGSAGNGRLTHRGDRRTRPTMYLMALMASLADPAFAFHKWRYRQKGQCRKQAVCSIMNKLAAIIWAVVHRVEKYDSTRMIRNILTHHGARWRNFLEEPTLSKILRQKIPAWAIKEA